jgi:heptosyltransferase-3
VRELPCCGALLHIGYDQASAMLPFRKSARDYIGFFTTWVRLAAQFGSWPYSGRKKIAAPFRRVLLVKTTQLGDLVISLPMASALKKRDPHCTVILLTNHRTADVARCCPDVDEVYGEPETAGELLALLKSLCVDVYIQLNPSQYLAKTAYDAGIPIRIGSLFRSYNWRLCTHLVALSSSLAGLNKRLLDLQYLAPLGIRVDDLQVVRDSYRLTPPTLVASRFSSDPQQFAEGRRTIVLSPTLITAKAHQWPLASYSRLIRSLDVDQFHWFVCGTAEDRQALQPLLDSHSKETNVTDLVGKLTLLEFTSFIAGCDGLIAGSTGPIHLAAALGVNTLGLFQSRKVDIQRWHPVGRSAAVIHSNVHCKGERRNAYDSPIPCPCIGAIDTRDVACRVLGWFETAPN